MRTSILPTILLLAITTTTTTALRLPTFNFLSALPLPLQDFIPPILSNYTAQQQQAPDQDLLKRQYSNTCPSNFHNCQNLGAPGLCCAPAASCSADAAGNVACCPSGVACSGAISGVLTQGTLNSYGSLVGVAGATTGTDGLVGVTASTTEGVGYAGSTTTTGVGGLVAASTGAGETVGTDDGSGLQTSNSGFVIDGSSTVATPGAGVRGAEIPLPARAIIRALSYLPI
ncbi:hypothetical protein B0A50_03006 [Salinomyces thailandicus]|uniref:Uncharacterized protein n=1 Tax=Salinomyces thailandicus TaxID=706561 RepID=A0A4V5N4P8_9PEZI|nr:hypothetical protein B0A50_03006 [Salinomyces thailandica]